MALADSLQHKLGPLPTWGWLAIATAGFGVFYFIEKKKAASSSSTTPTNTSSATNTSGTTNPGGQGQVPPYVTVEQQTSSQVNSGNTVNSNNTAPSSLNSPTTNTGPGAGATTTGGTTNNNPAPVTAPTPIASSPARPTSITATGTDSGDLNQIAGKYGITENALIAANPSLKTMYTHAANSTKKIKLIGSGLPVPAGTKLVIPPIAK
jgi:hypothetical protein